jgi:hypothetical protein
MVASVNLPQYRLSILDAQGSPASDAHEVKAMLRRDCKIG